MFYFSALLPPNRLANLREFLAGSVEVLYRCLFWGILGFIAPLNVRWLTIHVVSGLATAIITALLIALVEVHKLRRSPPSA